MAMVFLRLEATSADFLVRPSYVRASSLSAFAFSDILFEIPMTRSIGRSVRLNYLKWREVTLPCSYRSTCLLPEYTNF